MRFSFSLHIIVCGAFLLVCVLLVLYAYSFFVCWPCSYEPVPFAAAVIGNNRAATHYADTVTAFDEVSCARGVLGRFTGIRAMEIAKELASFSL